MSTSESWGVNRHTAWYTSPVYVVSQCKLVSGWGLRKWRSAPPYGPCGLERTLLFFTVNCAWTHCTSSRKSSIACMSYTTVYNSKRASMHQTEEKQSRGVRNPMKISDIGFLKTEVNWTDFKIQKLETRFPRFGFQKTDFGSLGTVFHVVSFTIHLAAW